VKNNELVPTPRRAAMSIKGIVANNVKMRGSCTTVRHHGWCKPATGVVKLNVDAGF
jgi:hypothetical protein